MIAFLLVAAHALAADDCSVDKLTASCTKLYSMKRTDTIQFANGFTMPACALNSVDKTERDADDKASKQYMGRMASYFAKAPPGSFSEYDLKSYLNGNNLDEITSEPPSARRLEFERLMGKDTVAAMIRDIKAERARKGAFLDTYYKRAKYRIDETTGAREERLFDRAKTSLENYLLRDRNVDQLPPAERNMLERVRSVRLRKGSPYDSDCGPAYTSFFDYGTGEAGFPPRMMFHTDESLFRAMVHELSHSIDRCRLSEPQQAGGSQPAVTDAQNPYFPVMQCLVRERKKSFVSPVNGDPLSKENICLANHHEEGFCEWMAGEVMAKEIGAGYFAKNPSTPVAPVNFSLDQLTAQGNTIKVPKGWETIFYQLDAACGESRQDSGSHPLWRDRLEQIILRKPEIRSALGCKPSADAGCRPPAQKSSQPSGPSPGTTR